MCSHHQSWVRGKLDLGWGAGRTGPKCLLRLILCRKKVFCFINYMGSLQVESGDCDAAIHNFQNARAMQPGDSNIMLTLANSMLCGAHEAEGLSLLGQVRQIYAKAGMRAGIDRIDHFVSHYIVSKTIVSDLVTKRILNFQTALKIWSDSPWARLGLARIYWTRGRKLEAINLMKSNFDAAGKSLENIESLIIFYLAIQDFVSANKLALSVVDNQRTPLVHATLIRTNIVLAIDQIKEVRGSKAWVVRMLELADCPDVLGIRAVVIAQSLIDAKQSELAPRVLQSAVDHTNPPSETQRISYVAFLLSHDFIEKGRQILQTLRNETLSQEGRVRLYSIERVHIPKYLKAMASNVGIKQAVKIGEGYRGSDLDSAGLRASLLQLQVEGGSIDEARRMANDLPLKYPGDQAVWISAIRFELSDDRGEAGHMAAQAAQRFGDNPAFLLEMAGAFKEAGMKRESLSYYLRARAVRVATGR